MPPTASAVALRLGFCNSPQWGSDWLSHPKRLEESACPRMPQAVPQVEPFWTEAIARALDRGMVGLLAEMRAWQGEAGKSQEEFFPVRVSECDP